LYRYISGLPGLTPALWRSSLEETVAAAPDHVSVYDLQVEEGTPFGRWYIPGEGPMPREEEAVEMFKAASEVLRGAGYEHYEVSSYAQPGARCEHNQVGLYKLTHSLKAPGFNP
jgi:coproporphyrinogen III oxidase-like Fe-S oxidoreductase